MSLFDKLRLNENYIYAGQRDELEKDLSAYKGAIIERLGDNSYKLRPRFSLGTLRIKGFPGAVEGINVKATITELDQKRQRILFTTRMRIEHIVLAILFPLLMIGFSFSNEPKIVILYITGIWIISHLWFQWIYRRQESAVVNKIGKALKLAKVKQSPPDLQSKAGR